MHRSRSQLIAGLTLVALTLMLGADPGGAATRADSARAVSGLVAAYGFDEGSGSTVADASGGGNTGTASNTTWSSAGRFGGALAFDGKDSWVTVPEAPSLDLSNAMTLEAWVHPNKLGTTWRTAIIKEAGNHLTYALYANTDTGQPSGHVFIGDDLWARGRDPLPGNDCHTVTAPCASFDRAYHAAQPGQVVQAAGGTYPTQTLYYDASKEGATQHVVFQPAPAASVTIDGNLNSPDVRVLKGASHVTFRDLTVLGDVLLEGCGVPDGVPCPADQTRRAFGR